MTKLHPLLLRQIKKVTYAGGEEDGSDLIDYDYLFEMLSRTYEEHYKFRQMYQRAMRLMSEEMTILNQKIQEEADKKIGESERRLQLAVSSTNDGIWDWNVASGEVWYSPRWKEMFGYGEDELPNTMKTWAEVIHPEDKEMADNLITEHLKDGTPFSPTLRFLHKDGSTRYIMCRASATRDSDGVPIRMTGVNTDITNIMDMQKELETARDEAEAANRAKSDFLANMSHEIRTPMNGILGAGQLLSDTNMSTDQKEYIDIIHQSADNLVKIINDILDLSKIEAGHVEMEPAPFNLRKQLEEITSMLKMRALDKQIELILRYPSDTPENVISDAGYLRHVLENIVGNAVKFTEEGHVLINMTCLEKDEKNAKIRFEISDTGIGIPQNQQETIFEKFRQVDNSSTRQYGGTGLGLSIAKNIVAMLGGELHLESVEGEGSTFWFAINFEIDTEAKPEVTYSDVSDEELQYIRCVLVEDHPIGQQIISEMLHCWDISCDIYDSAEALLEDVEKDPQKLDQWHVGLVDYYLPQMNGTALAHKLQDMMADKPRATKLVLITSDAKRGSTKKAQEDGFFTYLAKPVRQEALHTMLIEAWGAWKSGNNTPTPRASSHAAPAAKEPESTPTSTEDVEEETPSNTPQVEPATNGEHSNIEVLVVEDNVINQKVAVRMLSKQGCKVDVATDGKQCTEMLEKKSYDVIFMDCMMPVMDGFEATAYIRNLPSDKKSSFIIAMTANAMQGDKEKCLAAGMDDYVSKPVKEGEIRRILGITSLKKTSIFCEDEA